MRIFHIASVADWEAARASGTYTTSTRGRTLAEEGFIHASRGDQWQGVRERFYADVDEPLLLLVIDPDRLTSPVVDEAVPDSHETFPHVYGPIDVDAVVQTIALDPTTPPSAPPPTPVVEVRPEAEPAPESGASFSRLFFEEMTRSVVVASAVLAVVVAATFAGRAVDDQWGPITGALVGLVAGVLVARWWGRRARSGT